MTIRLILLAGTIFLLAACNPTIRLEGGEKPMEFNVNIKHEILIKIEKQVEDILSNDELF